MEFSQLINEVNKIVEDFNLIVLGHGNNPHEYMVEELPYLKGKSIKEIYKRLKYQSEFIRDYIECYHLNIDKALELLDSIPDKQVTILR